MTGLFGSKRIGLHDLSPFFRHTKPQDEVADDDEEGFSGKEEIAHFGSLKAALCKIPSSTAFVGSGRKSDSPPADQDHDDGQFQILDILAAALRKSLVMTCSVDDSEDSSSMDISSPTQVRHVSHVTFDSFNGFLGLPDELEPVVPRKPPSASASVFGVSPKSMQCSHDDKGNSVPTILLRMQSSLYSQGGLRAEGIFRIAAANSKEQHVKEQLNQGLIPPGVDVHSLAGLIKAWFRELPTGILDCLDPEQVMHCITEDDCTKLVKFLPQTETSLLDWAINLMADVAQHEKYNKMNAQNIATVFAPNMTKMSDPLTALLHAVQVMNFLKTLILMTLREREPAENAGLISPVSDFPAERTTLSSLISVDKRVAPEAALNKSRSETFLRSARLGGELEVSPREQAWSFHKSDVEEIKGDDSPDWLQLRKGMRKLCRHQMFHFH